MRERELKRPRWIRHRNQLWSLPMRERELKHFLDFGGFIGDVSLPMRERELKLRG